MPVKNDRVPFTKAMKKDYTVLIPMMLPIHFEMMKNVLQNEGYRVELLQNTGPSVVETGLKYVQNDTCYPALLVIGQMIDALNSGRYDVERTALIITQTGGGCRASNYIHLLRKALKKAGYGGVPVISLNPAGLERNPGFRLTLSMLHKFIAAAIYGDLMMLLQNQTRPYEAQPGAAQALVSRWTASLSAGFNRGVGYRRREIDENLRKICRDFAALPLLPLRKVKVGVVGEIYVKYSALANNGLENFLTEEEGCEVRVPGLMGFLFYCCDNRLEDARLYGSHRFTAWLTGFLLRYFERMERSLIGAVRENTPFEAPMTFYEMKDAVKGVIGYGTKMGEGWLLTGEMVELIRQGVQNVVCTQPFGCLPNHISGKGMIRRLRNLYPESNIVPIDYDPGATRVNQENRIKLMLAMARERMEQEHPEREGEAVSVAEAVPAR
ncbi:MAG: 2-hydroxyacyl-CoA dehydratase [Oscillospiraceae bacterium]|nr:2-hydroxyacyl-CoA dehydratase [Oscillospiraceae bacterium]